MYHLLCWQYSALLSHHFRCVYETAINEILSLKDKSEVIKILDDTINMHSDEAVKENARSVKSLLALS